MKNEMFEKELQEVQNKTSQSKQLEELISQLQKKVSVLEEEKKLIITDSQQRLSELNEDKLALQRKLAEKLKSEIPEMPESPIQERGVLGTVAGWFSGNDD